MCSNVELHETFEDVCGRVRPFVNELMQKYANTSHNVLLATHLTTANAIRHIVDDSVNRDDDITMGSIVQLF